MELLNNTQKDQVAINVTKSVQKLMSNLYTRWREEKKHEKFSDYEKKMQEEVSKIKGVDFIKGIQCPFGFIFKISNKSYNITVKIKGDNYEISCRTFQPHININQFLGKSISSNNPTLPKNNQLKR